MNLDEWMDAVMDAALLDRGRYSAAFSQSGLVLLLVLFYFF